MPIESTILSDFLATPEVTADAANARGSQDFSLFLNAVMPEGAPVVSAATPPVGNPTPGDAEAGSSETQDGDPSHALDAVLMMADQLGLDAKPGPVANPLAPAPVRAPAATQAAPVEFAPVAAATAEALPEALPQTAAAEDDRPGKADTGDKDAERMLLALADPAASPVIVAAVPAAPPPAVSKTIDDPADATVAAALPQRGSARNLGAAVPPEVESAEPEAAVNVAPAVAAHRPVRAQRALEPSTQPVIARERAVLESLSGIAAPLPDPQEKNAAAPIIDAAAPADDGAAMPAPLSQPAPAVSHTPAVAATNAPAAATGHQQVLEDLLVGNAVEDQWVDRLSNDVQALVSSDNREARLHLRPRDLGDLTIRLNIAEGQAKVHFTVETAAAQSMIADAVPRLQAMMENKGFRLDQASVDLGGQGANAGRHGAGADHEGREANAPGFMSKASPTVIAAVARAVTRQTAFERYA